jgi:hypothetical protein
MKKRILIPTIVLGLAVMACSLGSLTTAATPTIAPPPPAPILPATQAPTTAAPVTQPPIINIGNSGALPFTDDFVDPTSGWEVDTFGGGSIGYGNGYYFVLATKNGTNMYGSPLLNFVDNVEINVDATQFSAPDNNNTGYGVICRLQKDDTDDGYYFRISGDGYYSVIAHYNDEFNSLLSGDTWQEAPTVNQGDVTNHIDAICNGNQLTFIVNGTTVYTGTDDHFSSGGVGVLGAVYEDNATAEFHFTSFSATAP